MTRYFLDTEFNGMGGGLISLALVSEDGREVYLATKCLTPIPWVKANVMPIIKLDAARPLSVRVDHFCHGIHAFLTGDSDPVVVADWPDDIKYFCQCLIVGPGQMIDIPSVKFELVRVDAYPTTLEGAVQHNALWDARALRHKIMGGS